MIAAINIGFLELGLIDFLDIILVAVVMFQVYRLFKGNLAFNILIGFLLVVVVHFIVERLGMDLLAGILGQFIGVGAIALIIVFQPEIRRFLLLLGKGSRLSDGSFFSRIFKAQNTNLPPDVLKTWIVKAVNNLSTTKTGALVVFAPTNSSQYYNSGNTINADISAILLESIFQKRSPLHDGAVIIADRKIEAAGCVLPISEKTDLPSHLGLRHRAGIGITEQLDCIVIIVSEETGKISITNRGEINFGATQVELMEAIDNGLKEIF